MSIAMKKQVKHCEEARTAEDTAGEPGLDACRDCAALRRDPVQRLGPLWAWPSWMLCCDDVFDWAEWGCCCDAGAWCGLSWMELSLEQTVTSAGVMSATRCGLSWIEIFFKHTEAFAGDVCCSLSAAAPVAETEGEHLVAAAKSQGSRSMGQAPNFSPLTARKKAKFSIIVKTLSGKTRVFNVKGGDTVAHVLEAVEGSTADCYVLHNGRCLSLNQSLESVGRDGTLRVVGRTRGGATRRPLLQTSRDSGRAKIASKKECGLQRTSAFGVGAPNHPTGDPRKGAPPDYPPTHPPIPRRPDHPPPQKELVAKAPGYTQAQILEVLQMVLTAEDFEKYRL